MPGTIRRPRRALATAVGALALVGALAACRPDAPDDYWDRLAWCETHADWSMIGSGWSGGLGIYNRTWLGFGGGQFGPTAGHATREQQIEVANRIATEGWVRPDGSYQPPVGYRGWGCTRMVGEP